ncbi:hypothetical protein [Salsipaludibacter albus]|uniref:hypothetical protein n=1 Tax=Salsipaludibacter albus TaxID=2849650 RepID=UPI001EE4D7E2|nr:hypothetical protein [Salsipaludibacter albus]MBY5161021.1 hypothetical protein [Salsipaludibacter albus]
MPRSARNDVRRTACILATVGAALVVAVLAASPAGAQDAGIVEEGVTTWVVRPDDRAVEVTVELTLANATPDTETTRTYWSSWGLALPAVPGEITVRSGDTVVDADVARLDDGTPTVSWDFPDRLDHGERQAWVVEARFDSAPPRSAAGDGPRVDPAFVAVPIWAWGRDHAALAVRVPEVMEATLGGEPPTSTDGDGDVWQADVDATTFSAVLLGSSDTAAHDEQVVTVADTTVTVQSWPTDPEWGEQVAAFAGRALPALADWTGTSWDEQDLTIRETATPFVEGWGGANDASTNTISVGEHYDHAVWTHELAHNWFGPDEFADTWLAEGLSDLATVALADELGIDDPPTPDPPEQVLSTWDAVVIEAQRTRLADPSAWQATVGDLYDGAHHVVATVADEVGPDAFREIVRMTLSEESSWSGPGEVEVPEAADWREFLTLAERVGGSTTAGPLLVEHVVPEAGPLLARRDEVLAAYAPLEDGPWAPPLQVRRALQAWSFDRAEADIARAVRLRDDLATTTTRAAELGVGVPDLRETWEVGTLARTADRLEEVDAVLDDLERLASDAEAAELPVPELAVDPAEDDLVTVAERLTGLDAALRDVVRARSDLEAARTDRLVRVGLVGSVPDRLLEDAVAAFAAGDLRQVAAATGQLDTLLQAADDRGRQRLGGLVAVVVLVAVGLVLVVRRRRRRRHTVPTPPGGQSPAQSSDSARVNAGGR